MQRYQKIIFYLISLCLCVWYLTVIYWAKHPDVCVEYRMYYLNKQLMDWPGYGGLNYNLGDKLFFGTKENGMQKVKFRGHGWSSPEEWGNWTVGRSANLYFSFGEKIKSDLELTILANAFRPEGFQNVDVLVNESLVGTLKVKHSTVKIYNLIIPKEHVQKFNPMHLEFTIHNPNSPEAHGLSEDRRMLGIAVYWMKLESVVGK